MNVLIATKGKGGDEAHKRTVKGITTFLKSIKVKYKLKPKTKLKPRHFKNKDLVIAVGGDGTFLDTARYIFNDTKILGVKSTPKSVGAHCTANLYDVISKLEGILDGEYKIIKATRLEAILNGKLIHDLSSNEIHIGNKYSPGGSKYILEYGIYKEQQSSSGVVCVAGMGSSAWYKNIIGNTNVKFKWDSKHGAFVVREPEIEGQYEVKQIKSGAIYSKGELDYIKIKSLMYNNGTITFDGSVETEYHGRMYKFPKGSIVEIRVSDKPLSIIYFDKI